MLHQSPVTKNSSNKPRLHFVRRKDRAIPYSRTSWSAPFTFSELNKCHAFINVKYYSNPNEYSQYSLVDLCKIQEDDILSSEKYLATWWGKTFPAIDNDVFAVQSFYVNRRMPKCNTVLQSENDLFEHKFNQIRMEIDNFWLLFGL